MAKKMNEQSLEQIGQMAEECDSVLFAYKNMQSMPDRIHLQAMKGKLEEVRDELARIYKANGGTEELDLQA